MRKERNIDVIESYIKEINVRDSGTKVHVAYGERKGWPRAPGMPGSPVGLHFQLPNPFVVL